MNKKTYGHRYRKNKFYFVTDYGNKMEHKLTKIVTETFC